jgi:tRNA nucleotidyltransferase (CCA-adding enzyme)
MRVPAVARTFASVFRTHRRQCWLVGGAVRDLLLGRPLTDLDIATDAPPEEVMRMFSSVIPTGIKHGTVTVMFKGTRLEVTTFRTETGYSDGRRPDSVSFVATIEDDLARRDFTINALALDLLSDRLEDPHGGTADLGRRLVRAIGEPDARFREDGLRPVRACRFAAQLEFEVDPATLAAIPRALPTVALVSAERVRDELVKILGSRAASRGLRLMHDTGLLALLLPELAACAGVTQGELHCYDVLDHSLAACDEAPTDDLVLRLAALLHDVGKPLRRAVAPDGRITFYGHEQASAELAEAILLRLRFPTDTVRTVRSLVAAHMFNYTEEWSDGAVRRLIARVGEQLIDNLIALRRADAAGMCPENRSQYPEALGRFSDRVRAVRAGDRAFTVHELAVGGREVMGRLGIGPGPAVGAILAGLLEAVLEDPALNTPERLLDIAERLYRERIGIGRS